MKKSKQLQRISKNAPYLQGIFGSGPVPTRRVPLLILLALPVLLIATSAYVFMAKNNLGMFAKSKDIEKGLVQATDVVESPASAVGSVTPDVDSGASVEQVADIAAGQEGESTGAAVAINQLPAGEEAAVERAAIVDTTMDNHEIEVMGGEN